MRGKYTYRGVVMGTDPPRPGATRRGVAPAASVAAKAKVRVGREVAGRSGKSVSVITGLPLPDQELDALAARLKKVCGAGGAVKSGTIEIQGDHRDRLVAELLKLGFEARRSGG